MEPTLVVLLAFLAFLVTVTVIARGDTETASVAVQGMLEVIAEALSRFLK